MRPKSTTVSIVLLGVFPPDKFTPTALADANVIPRNDANAAILRTLLPGAAVQFDLVWGQILVANDRFQVVAREAPYVRGSDLVVKALREISSESRVTAFGINVESHFDLGSVTARDSIGCRLAPPEAWGKWGREILDSMKQADAYHGGVVNIQMRKPFQEEEISGWMDVFAGPSSNVPGNTGIYLRSNHHHQVRPDLGHKPEPLKLLDTLTERFDASVLEAENIFNGVLEGQPE